MKILELKVSPCSHEQLINLGYTGLLQLRHWMARHPVNPLMRITVLSRVCPCTIIVLSPAEYGLHLSKGTYATCYTDGVSVPLILTTSECATPRVLLHELVHAYANLYHDDDSICGFIERLITLDPCLDLTELPTIASRLSDLIYSQLHDITDLNE